MNLLYINDELIDLYPNTVIAQTIQAFDINVGSIKTNFTNSIKIPMTANNLYILQYANDVKSGTTVPYSELSARYFANGIELIKNGKVILKEVDNAFILNIYSGPFGFFDFILQKKLWDLDFSGLNGPWTNSARDGYRNTTSGIIAPLADDGQLSFSSPNIILTSGNNMRSPWLYYHTVLERIVSSAGYTITGDILNDTFYKTLVMPLSLIYSPAFIEAKTFSAAAPGTQVMVDPANVDVVFDQVSFNGAAGFYDGTSRYIVDNPDTSAEYFICQFIARIAITVTNGTVDIELISRNGLSIGSLATFSNVGTGIYELISSPDFTFKNGDEIYVRIRTNTTVPTVTITEGRFYSIPKTGREDESALRFTIVEDFIYFNHLFEDINQLDFVKDFCMRFNVKISEINGQLVCKSMNDILADTDDLEDWTGKRAPDRQSKLRFSFGQLSQVNNFTYPGDGLTDDLTDDYGSGYFEIPNVNIPETGTVYNSMFLKTGMITYQNAFIAYVTTNPLTTSTFENVIGKRLLLVRSKYTSEPNVTYNVTPRSDYKIAYFIDPKQAFSMHWQYFIDNYYADFVSRIAKTKVKIDYYYLTDLDIAVFNNLKMIHDDGVNYLVTKINNYISGKISEVELFKVS